MQIALGWVIMEGSWISLNTVGSRMSIQVVLGSLCGWISDESVVILRICGWLSVMSLYTDMSGISVYSRLWDEFIWWLWDVYADVCGMNLWWFYPGGFGVDLCSGHMEYRFSLYKFYIGFWNCSDCLVFFNIHYITIIYNCIPRFDYYWFY